MDTVLYCKYLEWLQQDCKPSLIHLGICTYWFTFDECMPPFLSHLIKQYCRLTSQWTAFSSLPSYTVRISVHTSKMLRAFCSACQAATIIIETREDKTSAILRLVCLVSFKSWNPSIHVNLPLPRLHAFYILLNANSFLHTSTKNAHTFLFFYYSIFISCCLS